MIKKTIEELLSDNRQTWKLIQSWLKESSINYEILDTTKEKSENTVFNLQTTTKSTLGAIAYETGGILVEHGWLKILGSGNKKIFGDLLYWNCIGRICDITTIDNSMVVAYDIIGGFFSINGGAFKGDVGNVFYLPPDTLEWEDMGIGYTDFIKWVLNDNLKTFYEDLRWNNWINDISSIPGDKGFNFYPPLWSLQGSVFSSNKRAVLVKELWELNLEYMQKLS